jgi:hypothetical protein
MKWLARNHFDFQLNTTVVVQTWISCEIKHYLSFRWKSLCPHLGHHQIPKEDLEVGVWYSGKGRNGDVGLWDGEDFLVLGLEGKKTGPGRSDWENDYRIKREPYYTVDGGCFQPFAKVVPAHHAASPDLTSSTTTHSSRTV